MSKKDSGSKFYFISKGQWFLIGLIATGLLLMSWIASYEITITPWIQFAGGVLVTILVIYNLIALISEKERIVRKVEEKSEELKEERLRREAIFNKSFQFIGLLAPDGTLLEANGAALEFGGLKEDDVIGKKMWNSYWFQISDKTQKKAKEAIEKAKKGELVRYDLMVQGEGGREEWIDFSVKPVYDKNDKVKYLIPEGRLITERKNIENRLSVRNRALNAVREGVIITDPNQEDNPIIFVNEGFTRITGYTESEVEGQNCRILQGEDTKDEVVKEIREAIDNGESCNVVIKNYKKNGEMFWNNLSISPVFDEDENLVRFVGIQRDVTEERRSKEELKSKIKEIEGLNYELEKGKAKDEAVLDSVGESLVVSDQDGKVEFVNNIFEEVTGWEQSEVIGKKVSDAIPVLNEEKEKVPFEEQILTKVLKGKKRIRTGTDYYLARKDGSVFPVSITASPIILRDEVVGAVGVFRDMTKVKELSKAKDEFVSLASHQLRTPLTTINWYTEMLMGEDVGDLTEEQKKFLDEISDSSDRMIDLVNALLNVSRIESGSMIVKREELNLSKIANEVISDLKSTIEKKKINLVENYDEDTPTIEGDERVALIIFQNLISNAVKYTPKGGRVEVSVYPKEKEKKVYIKVEDNGYGIPEDEKSKIFTKLFRADNIRNKDTTGTGLGLYLVKSILSKVGGEIWFDSKEGEGTTFFVTLPFKGMEKQEGSKSLAFGSLSEGEQDKLVK